MVEQGIQRGNIEVWMDRNRDGCLLSCMKCFREYGKRNGGRWHLQDDVCISSDFREKTEANDAGVVSGFMRTDWQSLSPMSGRVPAVYHWNSFQCVRIPDKYVGECAEWLFTDAAYRDQYKELVDSNKGDDSIWYDFLIENHLEDYVLNLNPSIVEHVDFLIGGSVINKWRGYAARGDLWEDEKAIEELKGKLARR